MHGQGSEQLSVPPYVARRRWDMVRAKMASKATDCVPTHPEEGCTSSPGHSTCSSVTTAKKRWDVVRANLVKKPSRAVSPQLNDGGVPVKSSLDTSSATLTGPLPKGANLCASEEGTSGRAPSLHNYEQLQASILDLLSSPMLSGKALDSGGRLEGPGLSPGYTPGLELPLSTPPSLRPETDSADANFLRTRRSAPAHLMDDLTVLLAELESCCSSITMCASEHTLPLPFELDGQVNYTAPGCEEPSGSGLSSSIDRADRWQSLDMPCIPIDSLPCLPETDDDLEAKLKQCYWTQPSDTRGSGELFAASNCAASALQTAAEIASARKETSPSEFLYADLKPAGNPNASTSFSGFAPSAFAREHEEEISVCSETSSAMTAFRYSENVRKELEKLGVPPSLDDIVTTPQETATCVEIYLKEMYSGTNPVRPKFSQTERSASQKSPKQTSEVSEPRNRFSSGLANCVPKPTPPRNPLRCSEGSYFIEQLKRDVDRHLDWKAYS